MKRPSWATVIGILAIIFGTFGILGGAQDISMPTLMESQQAMMEELSTSPKAETTDAQNSSGFDTQMFKVMQENFKIPDWYKTWAAPMGIITILISAAYFYAGIALLTVKAFAIKLTYYVLGASISWALIQYVIFSASGSMMLAAQGSGNIASIVIDIIFGLVMFFGAKDAYFATHKEAGA